MLNQIPSQVYRCISFNAGEVPPLQELRKYFVHDGIFINNKGEQPLIKRVDDYIQMLADNIANGNILAITESELSQQVQVYGKVAQIRSDYQLVFQGKAGVQTRYGVNLFQLIQQGDQWLVTAMCWDDKTDKSLLNANAG